MNNYNFNVEQADQNDVDPKIFPAECLPNFLKEFSENIADVYGVPVEFPAMALISAIASAIGSRAKITTPRYTNHAQLWVVIVAPSGTGKSEPLRIAYKPIVAFEKQESERHKERLVVWNTECLQAKASSLPPPPKPKRKRITCTDTTPEALFALLADNPTLTICRDELSGYFQDFGRYNKSGEVGHYLSCFDNNTFSIDRKGSDTITISNPVLSMIGTIQPSVLRRVVKDNHFQDNGYLQRCLFVYPDTVRRPEYNTKALNADLVSYYEAGITQLLNQSEPMNYTLSEEAEERFAIFANYMTEDVNEETEDYLKSLFAKMEIHVLRLALILAIANSTEEEQNDNVISAKIMTCAINLAWYFIETGKMVFEAQPCNMTNGDIYRLVHRKIGIGNISDFASGLRVSHQAVSQALRI